MAAIDTVVGPAGRRQGGRLPTWLLWATFGLVGPAVWVALYVSLAPLARALTYRVLPLAPNSHLALGGGVLRLRGAQGAACC